MDLQLRIDGKDLVLDVKESAVEAPLLDKIPKSQRKKLIGVKVDGQLQDLHTPFDENASLEFISLESPEALELIRHSSAHILAQAVKKIHPKAQVTIGPVIEDGFFYDFSLPQALKEEDLAAIEKEAKYIIKSNLKLEREVWEKEKAIEYFKGIGENYKCEIIEDLEDAEISVYRQGDFIDLCRGPHLPRTGMVGAFKLTSVAGAYWRGDEKNEMLTRVYGTAWASQDDLKQYLFRIEEAKRRDHRKLGKELDLFSFHAEAPATPFFHPNGTFIYNKIKSYLSDLNEMFGFRSVSTPLVMSEELWKLSGHYQNYQENMYFTSVDERNFAIKPMNCPGHVLIYKSQLHSYKSLPLRMAEFGRVHRNEKSGVTAGLFRVRSFVVDDGHIFCLEEQIESEIVRVLKLIEFTYASFGFEFNVELSTRPEKRIGSEEVWDKAEESLKKALEKAKYEYTLNPGDGAFYGPKIDFHLKDSLGRTHQCGTIQLDFSMPERFELKYSGADNQSHCPIMIHRAVIGSLERFMGIYIEHVAGRFPLWLAPVQVVINTVNEEVNDYSQSLFSKLEDAGLRVELNDSADKLGKKIREGQKKQIPYILIIGDKELETKTISVRDLTGKQRQALTLAELKTELMEQSKVPSTEKLQNFLKESKN